MFASKDTRIPQNIHRVPGNSIKPISRHVIIPSPMSFTEWPEKVEEEEPVSKVKSEGVMVTLSDVSGDRALVFPDGVSIPLASLTSLNGIEKQEECRPVQGSWILVCAHKRRDKRCGVAGPMLIQEFQRVIQEMGLQEQVFVHAVSHVGGHKVGFLFLMFDLSISCFE